jgi:hypothetical protein
VIDARRLQRSFGDGLIAEEIEDLQETWMRHVDAVLQDEAIVSVVHQALSNRCPKSGSHGRPGYPAEVVLRLLILKHVRNWSYAVLEREVRANLVYRDFSRVGAGKMPDPRPRAAGVSYSDPTSSRGCMTGSCKSRSCRRWCTAARCGSTPRLSKATSIILRTAVCWVTGFGC